MKVYCHVFGNRDGNFILLDLEIEAKRLILVNIYGQTKIRRTFFRNIANHIEELGNDTCILCGDVNVIQDQNLDSFNYLHVNNPRAKECILSIKEEFNLVDPFRELYEFGNIHGENQIHLNKHG